MNLDKLREEIAADEGVKLEIYLDHLGLPTCGIGHLIRESDEEHGKPVGTPITEERMTELFEEDVQTVVDQAGVDKDAALEAIKKHKGDIAAAILDLKGEE